MDEGAAVELDVVRDDDATRFLPDTLPLVHAFPSVVTMTSTAPRLHGGSVPGGTTSAAPMRLILNPHATIG